MPKSFVLVKLHFCDVSQFCATHVVETFKDKESETHDTLEEPKFIPLLNPRASSCRLVEAAIQSRFIWIYKYMHAESAFASVLTLLSEPDQGIV